MRIAKQHIMRVAAVLALTAACSSAFAQSADYRRGYEEGYAAGQRDDRGGPGRGGLHILEANYGVRGSTCNARRSVRDSIERNRGTVVANDRLCGDSAPGKVKRLQVVYRCSDSEPLRATARQYDTLRLSCRR